MRAIPRKRCARRCGASRTPSIGIIPFYRAARELSALRASQPALRYGRQYFRPVSGDGAHFGPSTFANGVLAFSRILNDQEVVVVANTNSAAGWRGEVIVDYALNPDGAPYELLYSNRPGAQNDAPAQVVGKAEGSVEIHEADGAVTGGPVRALPVALGPSEVQILRRM